jgi:hypothetical protein
MDKLCGVDTTVSTLTKTILYFALPLTARLQVLFKYCLEIKLRRLTDKISPPVHAFMLSFLCKTQVKSGVQLHALHNDHTKQINTELAHVIKRHIYTSNPVSGLDRP